MGSENQNQAGNCLQWCCDSRPIVLYLNVQNKNPSLNCIVSTQERDGIVGWREERRGGCRKLQQQQREESKVAFNADSSIGWSYTCWCPQGTNLIGCWHSHQLRIGQRHADLCCQIGFYILRYQMLSPLHIISLFVPRILRKETLQTLGSCASKGNFPNFLFLFLFFFSLSNQRERVVIVFINDICDLFWCKTFEVGVWI